MISAREAILRQYDFLRYQRREVPIGKQYTRITEAMRYLKRRLSAEEAPPPLGADDCG